MKQEIILAEDVIKIIKSKRVSIGMSQQGMADYLDIKRGRYIYIENGYTSVRLDLMIRIIDRLGIRMYLG